MVRWLISNYLIAFDSCLYADDDSHSFLTISNLFCSKVVHSIFPLDDSPHLLSSSIPCFYEHHEREYIPVAQ
jgi:hypothetical protein